MKKQKGFLIPVAVVIVVGLGVLALAISRISGQIGSGSIQEGLSVQAFYAADSGAQFGMNQLFFSAADRATADTNCGTLSGTNINFTASGLSACTSTITCSISVDASNTTSFYLINSAATCGSADLLGQRTIEISAFMQ